VPSASLYTCRYFGREDLPYYYALSDGFTVGDAYHQSTFTQTSPIRMHLFSGSNNNHYNPKGRGSDPDKDWMLMNDAEAHNPGYDWPTMAETLEDSNVSWKVYMEEDNFDDNGFAWFDTFQKAEKGSALYDQGMSRVTTNQLVPSFEADVKAGKLPQVSWLVAPANQSEHARNHPAAGEDLTARFLKVLEENPDVYAKTAFIIDYDEGEFHYGGYHDIRITLLFFCAILEPISVGISVQYG
jgi:phospholipase C